MAPPPTPKTPARPAPGPGMGGLDLSALASAGAAETNTRIGGQQDVIDTYLAQVLGEGKAGAAADAERQSRGIGDRRSQQLVQEQLERRRQQQQEALQRARLNAEASMAAADRDFKGSQAAEQRLVELGMAAGQRLDQDLAMGWEREKFDRQMDLQEAQLGLEGGLDPTQLNPTEARNSGMGYGYVGADRGQYLNTRPVAGDIRGRSFEREGDKKTFGIGPLKVGDGLLDLGREGSKQVSYEDAKNEAGELLQAGLEPLELRKKLLELFNGSETAVSLALFELGDLGAAAAPPPPA